MYTRAVLLLLLSLAWQRVYCRSKDAVNVEDADAEQQTQMDASEEPAGSGAVTVANTTEFVPITEEPPKNAIADNDPIKCPDDLCMCTYKQDGGSLKVTVDCSAQDLTALPVGIDKRVTNLLLNNNYLEEIPKDIAEFKQLEELNMNDNSIKDFSFEPVSELPKLRVLKVAKNQLKGFPRELQNGLDFTSLQELDFGNNDMREELAVDLFTHMQNLSVLTIPISSQDLVMELCNRLGSTLEKVCINDCSAHKEECRNYTDQTDDRITVDIEPKLEYSESDDVPNQNNVNNDDIIIVSNDNEEKPADDNTQSTDDDSEHNIEETSDTASTTEYPQSDPEVPEITEQTMNENGDEILSTILPKVDPSTAEDSVPEADFSLRSAVNAADAVDAIPEVQSTSRGEAKTAFEGATPAVRTISAPIEQAPVDNDIDADARINKERINNTDDDVKVGATSVKKEGGIDNSLIALIVAGMVVVVAGVTIKKNWTAIRGKCSSRPTPATAATHGNGTTPEEVPLQDKANIV